MTTVRMRTLCWTGRGSLSVTRYDTLLDKTIFGKKSCAIKSFLRICSCPKDY